MILSIVIPTYNKLALLQKTLAALAVQKLGQDRDWEIVVVDDGSTDGTAQWLATSSDNFQVPLRAVTPGRNVGRARARNLGVSSARGRWVLFLDDDIVAPVGLLEAHLEILENNPGCGTIGYAVTEPSVVDAPHFYYLDSRGTARLPEGPAPGRFFVTQNAAVPRKAFLDVGGFDENFTAYGFEDMELAFRLEDQADVRFQTLTEPVPVHVHHHTLEEYWSKKVECGRYTLPMIARLHPRRIQEMKLHYVADFPGQESLTNFDGLVRRFIFSALGHRFPCWLSKWPTGARHRPLLSSVYCRLMNLAVLCCYAEGVSDSEE